MSSTSRDPSREPAGGDVGKAAATREEKRARFERPQRRIGIHLALAGLALVAVVAVGLVVVTGRGDGGAPVASSPVTAAGEEVVIPLADLADGEAKYYSFDAGGIEVKYFVLRSSDGEYRAAFDACDVCYPNRKGYSQQGGVMVCNNCGQQFDSTQINEKRGGCNPSPIERTVDGQSLVLKTADLQAGVKYFQ